MVWEKIKNGYRTSMCKIKKEAFIHQALLNQLNIQQKHQLKHMN